MHKDIQIIKSFIVEYPRCTSVSVLAWKFYREKYNKEVFRKSDDEKTRLMKLEKARTRVMKIMSALTIEDPALVMQMKLPLQRQTLEFYESCGLKAPESEIYFSLTPKEEESDE